MENVDIEKIYNDNFIIVYKFLVCLTHNKEIAEDLTQETFYKAIMNIDKFKGNCKMSVWLCEIAKNLWLNELKKRKKITFTDVDTIEIYHQYSIDEEVENKKEIEKLNKKISMLDKEVQKVVYLKLYGGMTFKEIGSILGKSEVWARVNFYRAKQKLKEVGDDDKLL